MQRTSLMIDGFLAYYEPTTITYTEGKITAITGPNGSGKTSIPDAVAWVRYGRVRVRGDSDSVISDFADEAHVVEELVDQNGQHWKFDRKKRRGKAQVLSVFSWNGADEEWQRYGTKRIADNQQIIDDLLGLNMNAFYSLSVFESRSGNRGIRLVSSKSEERIGILTSLRPSMAVWPELNKVISNDLREAKRELVARQDVLEVLRDDRAELSDEKDSLNEYISENGPLSSIDAELKTAERRLRSITDQESNDKIELIEAQRSNARMELKSKLRDIGDQIGDAQSELGEIVNATSHVEELTEEIDEINEQIKQTTASRKKSVVAVAKFETKIDETSVLVNEHNESIAVLSNALKSLEEKRLDLEERLRAAEDSEGHCVVCGSKITDAKHAEIIDAINDEMDAAEKETENSEKTKRANEKKRNELKSALKKAKTSLSAARDHIDATDEQLADLKSDLREATNALKHEQSVLDAAEANTAELEEEIGKLKRKRERVDKSGSEKIDEFTQEIREIKEEMPNAQDIRALENSIKRISQSRDDFVSSTAQIEQLEGQIKQKDTRILEQRELIEESRDGVADLELLKEATSQRGIPYLMLSDMLTNIEVKADEYLRLINGDHNSMTVDLEQNHESAKPTLEIMVTFADGTVRPVEALSNGEVTRVSLALMFALAHVVNSSRPGTVSDVFLDEPLAAVDDIGIDGVMSALRFAIDSGVVETILIVAHDRSIVDACDDEVSIDSIREGVFEDFEDEDDEEEE